MDIGSSSLCTVARPLSTRRPLWFTRPPGCRGSPRVHRPIERAGHGQIPRLVRDLRRESLVDVDAEPRPGAGFRSERCRRPGKRDRPRRCGACTPESRNCGPQDRSSAPPRARDDRKYQGRLAVSVTPVLGPGSSPSPLRQARSPFDSRHGGAPDDMAGTLVPAMRAVRVTPMSILNAGSAARLLRRGSVLTPPPGRR
jgi:hypothetical protein